MDGSLDLLEDLYLDVEDCPFGAFDFGVFLSVLTADFGQFELRCALSRDELLQPRLHF